MPLLLLTLLLPAPDTATSKPVTVPFDLLVTKHMVVEIKVNGKGPYRVIFDTGAPVSLLNSKVAKEAGLIDKNAARPLFNLFGPVEQTKIKALEVGDLTARGVPVIVMDHPTVEVISQILGPIEGIIGFPFFARYKMTLDYQKKEMTFVPSGYEPADVIQSLMENVLGRDTPSVRVLAPAGLWGLVVAKDDKDEEAGVTVKQVLAGGAAAAAGLRPGDRLLTLDGRWTDSVTDCYTAVSFVKPGTEVEVTLRRDGRAVTRKVKPQVGL